MAPLRNFQWRGLLCALCPILVLAPCPGFDAQGQTTYTKADNSLSLDQAASWNPVSVPTSADTAQWNGFYSNGVTSVGAGLSLAKLVVLAPSTGIAIASGTGSLALGSGGVDLSAATQDLVLDAPVTLTASQPWVVATGRNVLLTGSLTAGNGSVITFNSSGNLGNVILSPAEGQSVNLTGSNNAALLLQARTGGLLVLGGDGVAAPSTTSTNTVLNSGTFGALTVTGGGAVQVNSGTWNLGDLSRNSSPDFFSGSLEVRGGTLAFTGARFLGAGHITVSGGTLKVTNVGSVYSNGGKFALGSVGSSGTASMTVSGGLVDLAQANSAVSGGNSLGVGISSKVVQTGGTLQNGITPGGGTNGGTTNTFTIGHSGLITAGSGATLTYTAVSNVLASYTLAGGTLLSSGAIQGTTPASPGTNGTSGNPPGAVVNPGTGHVRNFNFNGGILAVGAFNATCLGYASSTGIAGGPPHADPSANSVGIGTLYNHGGTLSPGGNGIAGKTSITGNYVVNGGTLAIDLGGTTQATAFQSGQYDTLAVSGTTALGGNLSVSLLSGFVPLAGQSFTVLSSAGALSGSFANVAFGSRLVSADGLATFLVSQSGNNVVLSQYLPVVAPAIAGSTGVSSVAQGDSVILSVTANSLAPVTYQWRKDGVVINGESSSVLSLASVQAADSASYTVTISNAAGSVTQTFPLTVVVPSSTSGQLVPAGSSHTFQATPSVASYAWTLDGAPVGTNSSSFSYSPDIKAVGTHWLKVTETYPDNSIVKRHWNVRVAIPGLTSSIQYYVSPTGLDTNPGTIGAPFLTLEKARDTIRLLSKPLPAGGVMVYLRGGTHFRTTTLSLGANDSGSDGAPIIYTSYPGETAIVSGGKPLLASQFSPLAATEVARVAPGVNTARIWEADLAALGINRRGPFPNTYNEWQIYNALGVGSSAGIFEVFYNGKRMHLSRYPNHDLTNDNLTTSLKMNGVATGADNAATGYLNGPGNYTDSNGNVVPVGGAFHFNAADAARVARWQTAMAKGGVWVVGYWRVPWQINGAKVGILDTGSKQVIGLANGVNISNGIGYKYSRPAGNRAEPWWVVNLLEELDQPGEWCIDFSRGRLYFLMDADGAPPNNSVVVSDLGTALVQISGSYVNFQGVTFENGLSQGVQVLGGSRNLVQDCTFRNIGGYAVDLNNFSGGSYNGVVSCNMKNLASGGVLSRGGNNTASPRVPTNNFVVNNRIENYSEVVRVYAAAVDLGYQYGKPSVGSRVAHNKISGSPHGGILWKDFDHVIEFNEVSDYCAFSNDFGGIYTFASNYLSNTVIRYNYLHDSDHGEGIYFDSDHINATVYGNVVNLHTAAAETRGTGFYDQVPGGTPTPGVPLTDTYFNNIAVNCRTGFQIYSATGGIIQNNLAYANYTTPFKWNLLTATTAAYTSTASSAAALASGPNPAYSNDPGFVDFSGNDLRLRPDSSAYTDMPGFEPVPLEMSGLYNDEYRSDALVHTPFVSTGRASNLGSNVATFNGTLTYPQFEANATVLMYWGTEDGGTQPASWQNVENLGTPGSGALSRTLTSLAPGTQYFFRFYAVNSAGEMWSEQSNAATTYSAASITAGGTPLAGSSGAPVANAFDNNPATAWQTGAGETTGWIQYQLGGGSPRLVTQYQVTSAADNPARDPKDWQFLGSDDGVNWTLLDARAGEVFSERGQARTYGFLNSRSFLYFRLNITANQGDANAVQLAEWQIFSPLITPDTNGPVISTPGNLTLAAGSSGGVNVDFLVTAIDAVTGYAIPVLSKASGSLFPVGVTTVNVSAVDAFGNSSTASFTVTVTGPSLPGPWSVRNIGSSNSAGTASYNSPPGAFTVNATGGTTGITGDIWTGNNDNFTYISQPWTGDGIFTARLASFSSTDASAKAGIMFRETTSVGSKYSFTYLLRKGDAWSQHKTATSGSNSTTNFFTSSSTGKGIPYWIRLVRAGNLFTSYISSNGTTWTQLGAERSNSLNGSALTVGFAVGPRTASGTATAVFDNVSFLSRPAAPAGLAASSGPGQVGLTWSAVATANTYSVFRSATLEDPFMAIATGLSTPTFTDAGLTPGSSAYYQVTASNAVGEGSPGLSLQAGPLSAVAAWRFANLGSVDDAGPAGNSSDPDRDGLNNLLEYALGTNPLGGNAGPGCSLGVSRDRLRILFAAIDDPWITYRVEATGQLVSGPWEMVSEFRGGPGVAGPVEIQDTVAVGTINPDRRFMRLSVTHSAPP